MSDEPPKINSNIQQLIASFKANPIAGLPESVFAYRNITLFNTCSACPEQYDAKDQNGEKVGYLRLRHGEFTVAVPDVGGEIVYSASPCGDGMFDDDEREKYLIAAVEAILAA